ncbi:MAG: hypothetical protein WDA27_05635 [Actinomycetota bacterium]
MLAIDGGLLLVRLILILFAVGVITTAWAVVDATTRPIERFPSGHKAGWMIALVVPSMVGLGWISSIAYFATMRRRSGGMQVPGASA